MRLWFFLGWGLLSWNLAWGQEWENHSSLLVGDQEARSSAEELAFEEILRAKAGVRLTRSKRWELGGAGTSFDVAVFPRYQRLHRKSKSSWVERLGVLQFARPATFRFSVLRNQSCFELGQVDQLEVPGQGSVPIRPSDYFGASLRFEGRKELHCLILKVETLPGPDLSRVRREDVLATWLFLDENYRPFGLVQQIANQAQAKETRWVGTKLDPESDTLTAGLGAFPHTLPNFSNTLVQEHDGEQGVKELGLGDARVRQWLQMNAVNRELREAKCQGHSFRFRDEFDQQQEVVWCLDHPWPTQVVSERALFILKRAR